MEGGIVYEISVPFDTQAEFILGSKGKSVSINGAASEELMAEGRIILYKGDYEIMVQLD